jgi:hypothetical protein
MALSRDIHPLTVLSHHPAKSGTRHLGGSPMDSRSVEIRVERPAVGPWHPRQDRNAKIQSHRSVVRSIPTPSLSAR